MQMILRKLGRKNTKNGYFGEIEDEETKEMPHEENQWNDYETENLVEFRFYDLLVIAVIVKIMFIMTCRKELSVRKNEKMFSTGSLRKMFREHMQMEVEQKD